MLRVILLRSSKNCLYGSGGQMTKKKSVEKSNPECRRSLTNRSELQKFVLHLLQGAMIGIGAVLPGISGGVLSVVFGI